MSGIAIENFDKHVVSVGTMLLPDKKRKAIYVCTKEGEYQVVAYLINDKAEKLWNEAMDKISSTMNGA